MFHEGQGGVGGVQHDPAGHRLGRGDIGDQSDVLSQQCAGQAGKARQPAGVTTKYVEREAVSTAPGDHLGEAIG